MVSHCANPHCKEQFKYLGQGKLFELHDVHAKSRRLRWLCTECSKSMVVSFDKHHGVRVLPRDSRIPLQRGAYELRV